MKMNLGANNEKSLSFEFELAQLGLYAVPYRWVWFRFHLAGSESLARVALFVRTLGTVGLVLREWRLAGVTFVSGNRLRSEHVARITVRIFVLLGSALEISNPCVLMKIEFKVMGDAAYFFVSV